MKVLHINTYDSTGGAAIACLRLHRGLLRSGVESRMFVKNRKLQDPTILNYAEPKGWQYRLAKRIHTEIAGFRLRKYRRSADRSPFISEILADGRRIMDQLPEVDLIQLHWVSGFIDSGHFFRHLPDGIPVVWTLHDMKPFTGGCHFDAGCGRFRSRCGICPALASDAEKDFSRKIWENKQRVLEAIPGHRLHLASPSRWLAGEVSASALMGRFRVTVIPNGVDTEIFVPVARHVARAGLRIPADARVVLFVSSSLTDERKGFRYACKAIEGLKKLPGLLMITAGPEAPTRSFDFPAIHFGAVRSPVLLSLIYSAADLLIVPSLQDNLPNTVLEAFACGTPVVGFDVGGMPDMVRPGQTGLLAPPGDAETLGEAVHKILSDAPFREELSGTCRSVAEKEYSIDVQAENYIKLYQALMNAR